MRPATKFHHAVSATNATTLTTSINCQGFNYAQIAAFAGASNGLHSTGSNTILEESDDNSTFTAVTTGLTPVTTTSTVDVAKVVWNVDLRGRKKYLKPTVGVATTGVVTIVACLQNGGDAPVTAAEINATQVANL